mgnify:FL=1
MIYTLNDIHNAIKFAYKTKFERRHETETMTVFIKPNVTVFMELAREQNQMSKKDFKEKKKELLTIIKIAKTVIPLKEEIKFKWGLCNSMIKDKEHWIEFRIGTRYFRKRESKVERAILRQFLRKEFAKRRF